MGEQGSVEPTSDEKPSEQLTVKNDFDRVTSAFDTGVKNLKKPDEVVVSHQV